MNGMLGVAVGCGWQAFVAYVNVGCYYIVGIPLGAILGFYFNFGAKVNIFLIHIRFWILFQLNYKIVNDMESFCDREYG